MASDSDPLMWGIFALIAGIAIFVKSFSWRSLKNLIENTPTSKIRSLAMGIVEIYGEAVPARNGFIKSPFSGADCVYCIWEIFHWQQGKHGGRWVSEKRGIVGNKFYVRDDTGVVMVNPEGASTEIPVDYSSETLDQNATNFMTSAGVSHKGMLGFKRKMKVEERYIAPGDKLYIMGTAGNNPDAAGARDHTSNIMIQQGDNDKTFFISDTSEKQVLDKLRWKVAGGMYGGAGLIVVGLLIIFARLGMLF